MLVLKWQGKKIFYQNMGRTACGVGHPVWAFPFCRKMQPPWRSCSEGCWGVKGVNIPTVCFGFLPPILSISDQVKSEVREQRDLLIELTVVKSWGTCWSSSLWSRVSRADLENSLRVPFCNHSAFHICICCQLHTYSSGFVVSVVLTL